MKNSIPIRIYDWDFVLSEVDRHQIENLIWLQISPHIGRVEGVKFEIVEYQESDGRVVFRARCFSRFLSGTTVESIAFAASKVDAIVELGRQLRADVSQRARYESTVIFRSVRWGLYRLGWFSSSMPIARERISRECQRVT